MTSALDNALQRALSIRLNLQITLSSLPFVEEWMDIHLDRWLEHVPMPPEMPDGHAVSYLASLGSDLRRLWWGAWGNPRGFVVKMADYFKLCNMAKSDEVMLDQIGLAMLPELVGSWVGVVGGKVVTGWHFWDPHDWDKLEALFGTHEAKFQLKKWVADNGLRRFERFTQSIGEDAYSEIELAVPGDSVDAQVTSVASAFNHFMGAPLDLKVVDVLRGAGAPDFSISVRVRAGKVVRLNVLAPALPLDTIEALCSHSQVGFDPKLGHLISAMSAEGISRVQYGRTEEKTEVDVFVEPTEAAKRGPKPPPDAN